MIKFLLEKFRQAPGPMRQPRLIVADLAEEALDLLTVYLKREQAVGGTEQPVETAYPASPSPSKSDPDAATVRPKIDPDKPGSGLELDPRLAAAIEATGNKRKQEFKVLAILWDAKERNNAPMSAKTISQHGTEMGLSIRHENVRKVIRMRLDKYVDVHAEGVGSGTVYRYRISSDGIKYFTAGYFK